MTFDPSLPTLWQLTPPWRAVIGNLLHPPAINDAFSPPRFYFIIEVEQRSSGGMIHAQIDRYSGLEEFTYVG